MKNSLFHRTVSLRENEHKMVHLEDASSINLNDNKILNAKFTHENIQFYYQSGLKFIFDKFIEKKTVRENLHFLFIENSNMPSALLDDELDAYTLTWEVTNDFEFNENVSKNFRNVISALQETKNALFWHKDFFHKPKDGKAIITYFEHIDTNPTNGRETLKDLFGKVVETIIANSKGKKTNDKKIKYYKCYDEQNVTTVNIGIGQLPFNFSDFKNLAKDEKDQPPTLLHTLNHILYDVYFRGKSCVEYKGSRIFDQNIGCHCISNKECNNQNNVNLNCDEIDTVFVSIPVLCANPTNDKDNPDTLSGFGALFLYLGIKKDDSKRSQILNEIEEFSTEITSHLRSFSQGYAFRLSEKIENTAIRAAISQVMARNTSHNIGSHVMNKLINPKYLNEEIKAICECNHSSCVHNYQTKEKLKPDDKNELNQIAIFNNYLKCRMDYISDITFNTPIMQTNKSKTELLKEFDKVRLLLENISGLSKFHYQIKFTPEIKDERDIMLAMPNDLLGCQAFYNIIENVIRNTAKHQVKTDELTVFTVNFKEISEEDIRNADKNYANKLKNEASLLYAVEIFDSIKIENVADLNSEEKAELKENNPEKKGKDISKIDWLIYNQNKKLNGSILQQNKKLRSNALGLIEMEASAAYLRKLDISQIDNEDFHVEYEDKYQYFNIKGNFNVLKAFKKKHDDGEYSLGYRFFMLKPTEILIVTDSINSNDSKYENLKIQGVWIVSPSQFEEHLRKDGTYNHQFLVYDSKISNIKELIKKYKTAITIRVIECSNINDILGNYNFEVLQKNIMEKWVAIFKKSYEIKKIMCFSGSVNKNPLYKSFTLFDHLTENQHINDIKEIIKKYDEEYYDVLSTNAQNKLPDFTKLSITLTKYITENLTDVQYYRKHCLIESCLSKVIIIDERIQEAAKRDYEGKGILFQDLYKMTGIIVPSNVDLSSPSFDVSLIKKIDDEIQTSIKNLNSLDFILIHYSILERMFESNIKTINTYLDKISEKVNVVITSGRGVPSLLTDKVRFINLSSVIDAFVEVRSKYLVNYLLYSTRKTK